MGNVGDYYVYNYEYALYSRLVPEALSQLDITEDATMLTCDCKPYEFHMSGIQYRINWDTKAKKLVYYKNENTVHLHNGETGNILNNIKQAMIRGGRCFLACPARNDATQMLAEYESLGCSVIRKAEVSQFYGSMTIYELKIS